MKSTQELRMSLSLSVLGSGSGGNCTLVVLHDRAEPRIILIDAGLSPQETANRLGPLGYRLTQISDILVTHTDHDHLHRGWAKSKRCGDFIWRVSRRHLGEAVAAGIPARCLAPFDERFRLDERTPIEAIALPHDDLGTMGLLIGHGAVRLGYVTDLGRVPPSLLRAFTDLDALAIESNYDRAMQQASDRPDFLKQRIMGGLGHLSNEQSLDAVLTMARSGSLQHVVLLHLSRHCNDPQLVQQLYAKQAPHLLGRLTISNQYAATPMLHVTGQAGSADHPERAGRQLNFLETRQG